MKICLLFCGLLISFNLTAQNIGVGNIAPTEKLDVTGNIKADTIKPRVLKIAPNAAAGNVLLSDANGNASWQNAGNLIKIYNGLSKMGDSINLGGRLYNNTSIKLAQNEFSFLDIGSSGVLLAGSTPAGSNIVLSSTPITQTFVPVTSAQLNQVQLNVTALAGGQIVVALKNSAGSVIASASKLYSVLTNGLDAFGFDAYLDNTQTYMLAVTGSASAFLNYDASSNAYPAGSCSLGANADLAFNVLGNGEESLVSFKTNKVGIGTSSPTEKLEVNGNAKATNIIATNAIQLTNGAGTGKVLTSDAIGSGSWVGSKAIPGTISAAGNLYGGVSGNIPVTVNTWEFFGPSTTIVLNGNQRVIVDIVAALGKAAVGSASFRLDIGYQLLPSATILNSSAGNYVAYQPTFTASPTRLSWSMKGSIKPAAGTYKIGCVIYGGIAGYLDFNDFANGHYMIINE
jgi:hypothetical protein